jgi:hypothetical protein
MGSSEQALALVMIIVTIVVVGLILLGAVQWYGNTYYIYPNNTDGGVPLGPGGEQHLLGPGGERRYY